MFFPFFLLLLLLISASNSQCDYRPALHPATEVIFIVPDRTLGHLVSSEAWKGIENLLELSSANADTRMAIVQYGRDGRRGIVQSLTHSIEEARSAFRSSLTSEGGEEHRQSEQLPADQVYIDAAGLVEVMFGTLSNTVSSSSKDDAVVRKGAGLGLRTHVPWHVYVLAVANGRRRVTIDSEKEEEITQRFFDIIRPVVTKCVIEIFANDECLNKADQACRHVLGDPSHESSYLGRVGGFNRALTLSNALQQTSSDTSDEKGKEEDETEFEENGNDNKHRRELGAVSLQSRLLIAGGHVRIFSFGDLGDSSLLSSISTLVSPPPWCDRCISFGGTNKKYSRKCPRVENSCVPSHGCVPSEYVGVAWSDLPHRLAWDTLEMTPRSAKEGGRVASLAEVVGAKAGKTGEDLAQRARDAALRRTTKAGRSKSDGSKNKHSENNSSSKRKGMGLGGLLFSNGVPPRIARMGRKSSNFGHGHVIKRHSTVQRLRVSQQTKKSNFLNTLLQSKDRVPVVVRGGVWSTWPALIQWRDLGGNLLSRLSGVGQRFKVEVKVRERVSLSNKDEYEEAMFYEGDWMSSQMGMAGLVDDQRSGDYDILKLNGGDPEGIFILQDLFMHAGMNRDIKQKKKKKHSETIDIDKTQLLAVDTIFQVPKTSPILDDVYPPMRSPFPSFTVVQEETTLWISTPGTSTATISSSYHTVHVQLRGKRRFTMYSERHSNNFMVYPSIHPLRSTSRWDRRRITAYRVPHKSVASSTISSPHTRSEGEVERTISSTLRSKLKGRPIPTGIPSWSIVLSPGELLYIPPFMYYHTEVLSSQEAAKVASNDAGNAAAEDAGPMYADAAGDAAEEAHTNEGSSGWHGQEMGGHEDVSVTKRQEWRDPLVTDVVEKALGVSLAAEEIKTIAGRSFALRLHLDMVANRIVAFEGITGGESVVFFLRLIFLYFTPTHTLIIFSPTYFSYSNSFCN